MHLSQKSRPLKELSEALIECEEFANRGYILAKDAVLLLKQIASKLSDKLNDEIINIRKSNFNDRDISDKLMMQLSLIRSNFEILPQRLIDDIDAINKTSFSITLFGRTMAGKSTLMEILMNGKGESIGKGKQRTTRDVRSYTYRGMQITDVPGVAAFEGQDDENVAFDAAKKSDMIIFLITDDAPQAEEAECLGRVLRLGKPVICLINIKVNLDGTSNLKMFRRDIQKKFEKNRLDDIKRQFLDFGKQYGQDCGIIRFAYVHLKSAFLSQQFEYDTYREELYKLSRFNYVENLIVNEVCKNGGFYKMKAFSDIVVTPVVDALETLFCQSAENSERGSILVRKKQKFYKWTEGFKIDGESQIEALLTSVSSELKREIASFAEDNYDNSNASSKWNEILRTKRIEQRADQLLKQLSKECEEEIREISREINSEIKFSHAVFSDNSINMGLFVDGKRIWNWATTLMSGGLMLASLFISGPIGWVGLGFGLIGWLGSFFFSDREEKIRDARQKLEMKLTNHIDRVIKRLRKEMLDIFYNELLKKQLYSMSDTMNEVINSVFVLSQIQQEFAISLNNKLQNINFKIIKEALEYLGYNGLEWHISNIARIPGYAIMIVLEDGKRFPDDSLKDLHFLLKERVWFVFKKGNIKSMLTQAIGRGCDRKTIRIQYIDNIPRIAHIPSLDEVDSSTKSRIRMAQQITGLLIMK